MRSVPILQSLALSHRSDVMVLNNCSMWPPTSDKRLPKAARAYLLALGAQLRTLKAQILNFDRQIMAWHRSSEASKRLDEIPGVGPALATALVPASLIRRLSDLDGILGLDRARAAMDDGQRARCEQAV
jgi:transposase